MSGFDNGSIQSGVYFQAKQFGSVLRGNGPPVPQAGVIGDLYLDTQIWNLYTKRSNDAGGDVDPWGHYLFNVPSTYQPQLKWFGTSAPTVDIGVNGDYYLLWGGFGNYGLTPVSIYGPKAAGVWPGNATSVAVTLNPLYTSEDEAIMPNLTSLAVQLNPSAGTPFDNILIAGVALQTIKVYQLELSFQGNSLVDFWSNTKATNHRISGTFDLLTGGTITFPPSGSPWLVCQVGESFNLNSQTSVSIGGVLGYTQG